jgi:hypothetical protein
MGPKNFALAGEIADGVLLSIMASPAYVRYAVEHVRRGAERAGRSLDNFQIGAYLTVSISDDEHAARDAVKPLLATMIPWMGDQAEHPFFACPGLGPEVVQRMAATFATGELPTALVTDWMVDTFAIAGSPERCRERLTQLVEAGVTCPAGITQESKSAIKCWCYEQHQHCNHSCYGNVPHWFTVSQHPDELCESSASLRPCFARYLAPCPLSEGALVATALGDLRARARAKGWLSGAR